MMDTPTIAHGSYGSTSNNLFTQGVMIDPPWPMNPKPQQQELIKMSRRLVKVIIVDPNENITLEDCVLYSGNEKLTDATDQELFFEIDIKNILDTHNAKRIMIIDKKVKERTEYLEPAKIRDLKMVVVTIATF